MENGFKQYKRSNIAEMRPYEEGDTLILVSISQADKDNGSPKVGDMIARNPKNHEDQWLVAEKYFKENFEPSEQKPPEQVNDVCTGCMGTGVDMHGQRCVNCRGTGGSKPPEDVSKGAEEMAKKIIAQIRKGSYEDWIKVISENIEQSMKQERERVIQECIEVLNEHHDTLPLAKSESDNGYSIAFANAVNILEKLKK